MDNESIKVPTNKQELKEETRGRPPLGLVTDNQFVAAVKNAKTIDEVLTALPAIMSGKTVAQAKLYVSMRASQLRRKNILSKTDRFKPGPRQFAKVAE